MRLAGIIESRPLNGPHLLLLAVVVVVGVTFGVCKSGRRVLIRMGTLGPVWGRQLRAPRGWPLTARLRAPASPGRPTTTGEGRHSSPVTSGHLIGPTGH